MDHAARLLRWYDGHARELPWRVGPQRSGESLADPYHVWLSEIMLQQTVVKTVIPYFEAFLRNWPTLSALAACEEEEILKRWAGLGYYARARNLHACAKQVVLEHGGRFPQDEKALLALPGIGPYTASAIRAIAFDQPATVVDGNVGRVVVRLHALQKPLRDIKPEIRQRAERLTPARRPGDYAQAMMDLGATVCTPQNPACSRCPLHGHCKARLKECAAALPVRAPRKAKPVRRGTAFLVVREDGCVLLRQRPDKGLLARMLEVPATPWWEKRAESARKDGSEQEYRPVRADWQEVPGAVSHAFTHFHLQLKVHRAHVAMGGSVLPGAHPERCRWVPRDGLAGEALPGLMRKVISHGLDEKI